MSDGGRGGGGDGVFDVLDPKLTVFALANGMDLSKGDGYRRLEWFTEGLERGILIDADESGGGFRMAVLSWKTGRAEQRTEAAVAEGLTADALTRRLEDAIEVANALGPPA